MKSSIYLRLQFVNKQRPPLFQIACPRPRTCFLSRFRNLQLSKWRHRWAFPFSCVLIGSQTCGFVLIDHARVTWLCLHVVNQTLSRRLFVTSWWLTDDKQVRVNKAWWTGATKKRSFFVSDCWLLSKARQSNCVHEIVANIADKKNWGDLLPWRRIFPYLSCTWANYTCCRVVLHTDIQSFHQVDSVW